MILDRIVTRTRLDLAAARHKCPLGQLEEMAAQAQPPRDFKAALRAPGVGIIAEIKRASPSKGLLCPDFDPVRLATLYAEQGAAAISVLTDAPFFQGDLAYLRDIRGALGLDCPPLLRKDFLFDPYQIVKARAYGADAILLIVAILSDDTLYELAALARQHGMAALVEAHNAHEIERALQARAEIIGINNRNLEDFSVDLGTTEQLWGLVPENVVVVSESGIHTPDDVRRLSRCRIDAVLVGESLVTAPDPARQLGALVAAGQE